LGQRLGLETLAPSQPPAPNRWAPPRGAPPPPGALAAASCAWARGAASIRAPVWGRCSGVAGRAVGTPRSCGLGRGRPRMTPPPGAAEAALSRAARRRAARASRRGPAPRPSVAAPCGCEAVALGGHGRGGSCVEPPPRVGEPLGAAMARSHGAAMAPFDAGAGAACRDEVAMKPSAATKPSAEAPWPRRTMAWRAAASRPRRRRVGQVRARRSPLAARPRHGRASPRVAPPPPPLPSDSLKPEERVPEPKARGGR